MILFFICFNLPSSDFSFNKLEKISLTAPVLLYLFPKNTTESESMLKKWRVFSDTYKENKKIFFISVDCSFDNSICTRFPVKNLTFITIYHNFYRKHELIDNSIQNLNNIFLKSLEIPKSFCQSYILSNVVNKNNEYDYPTFILNYKDNSTCFELSKYKALFPQASFYIRNFSSSKNNFKIELCTSVSNCIPNKYLDTIDFIYDNLFDHFGDWNLNDVSKIRRRLVLIVYNDISTFSTRHAKHQPIRSEFENYIQSYSQYFLFGRIPYSSLFNTIQYLRNIDDAPFMLITNTKKTRFMIVDYIHMKQYQISDKINAARQGFLELSMEFFFDSKYALKNAYHPQNTEKFAFAAVCVIAITAILIFLKAYLCIHMFNHKSMNMIQL